MNNEPYKVKRNGLVTIGYGSYIVDGRFEFGNPLSHVLIGKYTSIAHRVTFELAYKSECELLNKSKWWNWEF